MTIEVTKSEPTSTTLVVKADAKDMQSTKDRIEKLFTKDIKIDGFRKGMAPAHLALKPEHQPLILQTFAQEFSINLAEQALQTKEIIPVTPPKLNINKFEPYTLLEITLEVEHVSKVELPDYKKFNIDYPEIKITEADIDESSKNIRRNLAKKRIVKRAIQAGDQINIDLTVLDKSNQVIKDVSFKDRDIIIGDHIYSKVLEDKLVGKKINQEIDFEFNPSKDFPIKALVGKVTNFKIKINEIQALDLPDDKDLIRLAGNYKTMKEYRQAVKDQILNNAYEMVEMQILSTLIEKLAQNSNIELPQVLIDDEAKKIDQEIKKSEGYTQEDLDNLKLEKPELKSRQQQLQHLATMRLKEIIALTHLARLEKIEINKKDIDHALNESDSSKAKNDSTLKKSSAKSNEESLSDKRAHIHHRLLIQAAIKRLIDLNVKFPQEKV